MTDATTGAPHPVFDPPPTPGDVAPLLIEEWLPVTELGIESGRRESNPRPPLNGFHVWWARRPLAACQGAQLAAVLPVFADLPEGEFGTREQYQEWVLRMVGIHGDVVGVAAAIERAKTTGARLGSDPYGYRPAFNNSPSVDDLNRLHRLLLERWGRLPIVLDPTAGGGAIPFAAIRYGLPAVANDLNPVAVSVQEATLRSAALYGDSLLPDIHHWGQRLREGLDRDLAEFFVREDSEESVSAYLWANTVACPRTGGPVPLAPNWWLRKGSGEDAVAARPIAVRDSTGMPSHLTFEIVADPLSDGFEPDTGTVSGGDAVSLWDGQVVDGDWIKSEAQAGRMFSTLYAVACWKEKKKGRGKERYFRTPTATDLEAVDAATRKLQELQPGWEADDVLPTEPIGVSNYDRGHRLYGISRWVEMFTARQLLVHGMFIQHWRALLDEMRQDESLGRVRADHVAGLLAAGIQNKAVNYNARPASWDNGPKQGIRSVFDKHGYSFKWTFAEFDASALWEWASDSAFTKFAEIARIASPSDGGGMMAAPLAHQVPGPIELKSGSATDLKGLSDGSVECVNVDPPYYDNVMYAELADFFYVWEKRTLGRIHPDRFESDLTDKDSEAVANPARFGHLKGRAKKEMANLDYQSKMRDIFAEARRVLRDDGVMVVWFTHKAADAWDTLGAAIMDAGFTIETSWPINTESATSLHQAKVNAAKSTIVLVCRKRPDRTDEHLVFFEDIEADMRAAARKAVIDFEPVVGHGGIDLLLSTYGPTLGVLSAHWPVMTSQADSAGNPIPLKPEAALDVARAEVAKIRIGRMVGQEKRFDPTTDFVLIAWDTYRAKGFPYDEARKLALGVGADVEALVSEKVLTKSGGNVSLVEPTSRVPRRIPEEGPFPSLYDAVCVLLRLYDKDGASKVRSWLVERGFDTSGDFKQAVGAYAAAVPRVRGKKGWTLDEARLIDEIADNVPTLELDLTAHEDERDVFSQSSLLS